MNINDAFPSRYLKAGDLPEGREIALRIEKVMMEDIGRDKQRKPVVYFEETDRGLVLNKTNAKTIGRIVGSEEFDDWTGATVNLYRAEVEFQGESVEAIRVKPKTEQKPKPPVPISQRHHHSREENPIDDQGVPF